MASDKPQTYFIDSNIFLRTLIKEDEKTFKECFNFLSLVQNKKIRAVTSDLVLAEINWVLESYYKFSKVKVISALEGITNLRGLTIKSATNPIVAVDLYQRNDIKFIDALTASDKLFASGTIIVSYDKDFDKLKIVRVIPSQAG